MGGAIDRLGTLLLDSTLAALALLVVVALAMVGTAQPVRRCALARGAILGLLALGPLVAWAPTPRIEVVGPLRKIVQAPGPGTTPNPIAAALALDFTLPRGVTLLYLAGVVVGLGGLALGLAASAWLGRRSGEPSAATRDLYETLSVPGSRPKLKMAGRLRRPVLVGVVRPTILIPIEFDRPENAEALRLGLLHELVHAERRDTWFGLAGSLAMAFWYFLPPLWWVRAQMRLDQEFLADRRASAGFGPFGTYAAGLVGLADPGRRPVANGSGSRSRAIGEGGGSPLFLRVLMLMRCPFPVESRPPAWWRWSMPWALAVGTLLASALTLQGGTRPGPAARSGAQSAAAHGTFQIDRLRIAPTPRNAPGRVEPYTLMVELPPRFDLTLEIWAAPAELAEIRVIGRRLGPLRPDPAAPILTEGFQHVQIRRDERGVTVQVAGRPVAPEPRPVPIPRWLSIQPAPRAIGQVRDLSLSW